MNIASLKCHHDITFEQLRFPEHAIVLTRWVFVGFRTVA